jgi:hypothetical protein
MSFASRLRLARRIGAMSATRVLSMWKLRAEPPRSTRVSTVFLCEVAPKPFLGLTLQSTNESFVCLYDFAAAAQRAQAPKAHCLTDTVSHEPRGLVADAKRPVQLMGGNAFLAGSHQVEGLQPLMQSNVRPLHYGFHRDGEVFPAALFGAAIYASALGLIGAVNDAAVRANRAIRPKDAFQHRPGGLVVLEVRFGKKAVLGHEKSLRWPIY